MKSRLLSTLVLTLASVTFMSAAQAANVANGISINGISINGISINGLKQNGLVLNGFVVNGLYTNGLYTNGLASNGVQPSSTTAVDAQAFISVQLPSGQTIVLN